MRPVSEATSRILKQSFNRKYVALGRIVNNWPQIVGDKLADKAQPVKIRYRKTDKKKAPEASLDIAVSSANATLLHYQKDLILERINQVFGERWITSIRFVSSPSNEGRPIIKKRAAPLTADEKTTLSGMASQISDDDVRERLQKLGHEILSQKDK